MNAGGALLFLSTNLIHQVPSGEPSTSARPILRLLGPIANGRKSRPRIHSEVLHDDIGDWKSQEL